MSNFHRCLIMCSDYGISMRERGGDGVPARDLKHLIPGVRNCMVGYAGLSAGERVLVIHETTTDPLVVEAFGVVAAGAGASVVTIAIDPLWPPRAVDDAVTLAMRGVDVAFGLVSYPAIWRDRGAMAAMMLHGTRYVSLATMNSYETLAGDAARWPVELCMAVSRRIWQIARRSSTVRVTNPRGTDITAAIDPLYYHMGQVGPMQSGELRVFPLGDCRIYPARPNDATLLPIPTGDGVAVFDGMYRFGLFREPVTVTVKDGWATRIEGGREARLVAELLEAHENGLHFNEVSWGLNPRIRLDLNDPTLVQANRNSSVVHLGFGDSLQDGGILASPIKIGASILLRPSVYLDETPVVQDGRLVLFDDPEIRELARRYGDPNLLLSEIETYE